jgi:hypothetical protein
MKLEKRTKDNPWKLKTPPQTSDYEMYVDTKDGKEIIVCTVGSTVLHYDYRALEDLHAMLKKHGDWMELGSKDEKQETWKAPWSTGHAHQRIPSAAGMDSKKASADDLQCTSHH